MICASWHIGIGYDIYGYVISDGARDRRNLSSKSTGDVQVNAGPDMNKATAVLVTFRV